MKALALSKRLAKVNENDRQGILSDPCRSQFQT